MKLCAHWIGWVFGVFLLACGNSSPSASKHEPTAAPIDSLLELIHQIPAPTHCDFEAWIPVAGKSRLLLAGTILDVINFRGGLLERWHDKKSEALGPALPEESPFEMNTVLPTPNQIWLLSDTGLWDWPNQRFYTFTNSIRPYINASEMNNQLLTGQLVVHTGHFGYHNKTAENRMEYGRQSALALLEPQKQNNSVEVLPLPLPITPHKHNNGQYFGFHSFYQLYDSILLFSYQKYPTVYLYHWGKQSVIDSFEFADLHAWGLQPLKMGQSTGQKIKQLQAAPSYGPAILHDDFVLRTLKQQNRRWLMVLHLPSRQLRTYEIAPKTPFMGNFGLIAHQSKLYQFQYHDENDMHRLRLCDFDLLAFMQQAEIATAAADR